MMVVVVMVVVMMIWNSITNCLNCSMSCIWVFRVVPFFIGRVLEKILLWSCIRSNSWLRWVCFKPSAISSMNMDRSEIDFNYIEIIRFDKFKRLSIYIVSAIRSLNDNIPWISRWCPMPCPHVSDATRAIDSSHVIIWSVVKAIPSWRIFPTGETRRCIKEVGRSPTFHFFHSQCRWGWIRLLDVYMTFLVIWKIVFWRCQ